MISEVVPLEVLEHLVAGIQEAQILAAIPVGEIQEVGMVEAEETKTKKEK
jgi:hypothetical protein